MQPDRIQPASIEIALATTRLDDPQILKEMLFGAPWELLVVANLQDAVRALKQAVLPIVFLDQSLAEESWEHAVHQLAKTRRKACVVMLAERPDSGLWSRVVRLGGFDVLARPLERDQVFATLMGAYSYCKAAHPLVHRSTAIPVVSSI